MKVSDIDTEVILSALRAYFEVGDNVSVYEIIEQSDDPIDDIVRALREVRE